MTGGVAIPFTDVSELQQTTNQKQKASKRDISCEARKSCFFSGQGIPACCCYRYVSKNESQKNIFCTKLKTINNSTTKSSNLIKCPNAQDLTFSARECSCLPQVLIPGREKLRIQASLYVVLLLKGNFTNKSTGENNTTVFVWNGLGYCKDSNRAYTVLLDMSFVQEITWPEDGHLWAMIIKDVGYIA